MIKKILKNCVQLAIVIILINASPFVAFGSIVEASGAYVQGSGGMTFSSNALTHAIGNSNEADVERGFGINTDVSTSTFVIISVITLLGLISMFKTFSFENEKPYRAKEGVVKLPGIIVWMLRFAAITFLLISLFCIFFGRPLNHIIEGLIVFFGFLFFHYITERWQVEVKDGTIIKTPLIGRKRIVPCEEMKEIVVRIFLGGIEYTLIPFNGKRLAQLCSWHWGVEDFMTELEKYDIPWSNKMVM